MAPRSFLLALLCTLVLMVEVQAAEARSLETAMNLYEWCTRPAPENNVCLAYIKGLLEGFFWGGYYSTGGKAAPNADVSHLICPPKKPTPTPDQYRLIYIKWAEANPARLGEPTVVTVLAAFTSAFPCH
jgi:hypothetical protein